MHGFDQVRICQHKLQHISKSVKPDRNTAYCTFQAKFIKNRNNDILYASYTAVGGIMQVVIAVANGSLALSQSYLRFYQNFFTVKSCQARIITDILMI